MDDSVGSMIGPTNATTSKKPRQVASLDTTTGDGGSVDGHAGETMNYKKTSNPASPQI